MYREAGSQAHAYFQEWAMPTDPVEIKKAHIEAWLIYLHEERKVKPATLSARFSALRRFFKWLEEQGEVELSPMVRMKAPTVDVVAPEELTDDEQRRLLDACRGTSFEDRRDAAISRLMLDPGLRRGEVAAMRSKT
jgi:site-specific recombinase XerC